jgi:ketosteroid isomerase-like protein
MADYPNAEPIRQAFDAFARGDMATMQSLVAEDTVWHIPGRGPLAGDHHGRDAVFEMFGRLVQGSEGTFDQRLLDVLTSEDRAVALTHATPVTVITTTRARTHGSSSCATGRSPRPGGDPRMSTPQTSSGRKFPG